MVSEESMFVEDSQTNYLASFLPHRIIFWLTYTSIEFVGAFLDILRGNLVQSSYPKFLIFIISELISLYQSLHSKAQWYLVRDIKYIPEYLEDYVDQI